MKRTMFGWLIVAALGLAGAAREIEGGRMQLTGSAELAESMQRWLGLSPFAKERKRARS